MANNIFSTSTNLHHGHARTKRFLVACKTAINLPLYKPPCRRFVCANILCISDALSTKSLARPDAITILSVGLTCPPHESLPDPRETELCGILRTLRLHSTACYQLCEYLNSSWLPADASAETCWLIRNERTACLAVYHCLSLQACRRH